MSDGATFEIDIPVNAPGVDSAAVAVARLADSLITSSSAATKAAQAVAAGEAAYRQAEASANRAALAVEKIGLAADAQRGKVAAAMAAGDEGAFLRASAAVEKLSARQGEAAAKAATAAAAMNAEAASLDKVRAAALAAADAESKVAKSLDAAKLAAKAAGDAETKAAKSRSEATAKATAAAADAAKKAAGSGDAGKIEGALGKLGGPLGAIGQKAFGAADAMKKLGESLGSGGPYVMAAVAVVALVAAVAALTAAAIVGIAHITAWAVGLSDAARSSRLLADGVAGSVSGGRELSDTIAKLGNKVPQTSEELLAMASNLAKTGLKGDALAAALEDAAIKAAQLKWGPDFAKEMLSIDHQTQTLKKHISGIFGGLQIESLLTRFSELVALFDSTSVSGKAIKVVFESLFQPIVDGITAFIPKMVSAFIQFEILVLKAMIAIKPYGSAITKVAMAFGILAAVIAGVIAIVIIAFLAPFVAIAAVLTVGVLGVMQLIEAFRYFSGIINGAVSGALDFLLAKFGEVWTWLQGFSLVQIGTDMIAGLVEGIKGAAGTILTAMTGAVSGAIDGAKKLLGIASPSKVFAEIGMQTGAGMAAGVDDAAGSVQGSLESMVAPPAVAPAGGGGAASVSGGGHTFNIAVTAATAADGESIAMKVRDIIRDLLEGDAGSSEPVPA